MKKFIYILGMLCSTASVAQIQKGDSNIGANLGIMIQNGDEDILNYSYTYFSVNYQYYVANRISIGIAPALTSTKVFNDAVTVNTLGINYFVDYNFLTKRAKVMPYVGIKYSTFNTTYKFDAEKLVGAGFDFADFLGIGDLIGEGEVIDFGLDEIKYKRGIVSGSVGMKFFVTERINIDNNLTFGTVVSEKIELDLFGSFSGSSGGTFIQFTMGFNYIIGRKKA